jgi:DNA-binding winged helix-turn-helix (wHTH) protein/Tfp pilus assembly protein PilF
MTAYEFGPFRLEPADHRLLRDGVPIHLPPRLFAALLALLERSGSLVDKRELMDRLWPGRDVEENNLDKCISALRKTLGDDRSRPAFIATVPKRGYRFVAKVRRERIRPVVPGTEWRSSSAAPTLAVAPFRGVGAPDAGLSGPAFAAAVTTRLAADEGFRLLPAAAVARSASGAAGAAAVGRALHADLVLEGSLQRQGHLLRVAARLVAVATGTTLRTWVEEQPWATGPQFRSAVASQLAAALTRLPRHENRRELLRGSTGDPEALRHYRRARGQVLGFSWAGWMASQRTYRAALARDPSFALAWADVSISSALATMYYADTAAVRQRARVAGQRALALDPELPEAHLASAVLAYLFDWDWEGAELSFERALALDPEQAWGHDYYGLFLAARGRHTEASEVLERAVALNPGRLEVNGNLGTHHRLAGRPEQAAAHHRAALAKAPASHLLRVDLGRALEETGDYEAASAQLLPAVAAGDGNWARSWLARSLALAGRRDEARRLHRQIRAYPAPGPDGALLAALVHAALRETKAAAQALEEAIARRSPWVAFLAVEPAFAELREDRRVLSLLRRVALRA